MGSNFDSNSQINLNPRITAQALIIQPDFEELIVAAGY